MNLCRQSKIILTNLLYVCNVQLRQAKKEVLSVTKTAMSFMFGSGSPTSGGPLGSTESGSNSGRRYPPTGSPSRSFSRNSPSSSQNGHSERHSRQSSEVLSNERPPSSIDSPRQSSQKPNDSPSQ